MHTEDALHQLAASSAYQTADAQDLALANRQTDVFHLVVRAGDVFRFKDHVSDLRIQLRIHVRDLPAHHHLDKLGLGQVGRIICGNILSVTVHTDPVANGKDLRHAVRDVDNGNALLLELADMVEEQLHFPLRNGGGRLIHDDHLGVDRDGLDDLDELALCHREVPQRLLGRHVQAALLDQLLRLFDLSLLIHQAVFPDLPAHKDIFVHGHVQDRIQLLMDHRNAHIHSFLGIGHMIGLSVEEDLSAGIFRINSHQDLHQGGLSGTVFSHQCMDFTGLHLQLHMVQCHNTRKGFADILHFQHIFHAIPPSFMI